MAREENLESITLEASGDLSANQFFFVSIDSNGEAVVVTAAGARAYVLQNDPKAQGEAANVGFSGRTRITAGASFTAGDNISSNASGKAVTSATGNAILGTALEDAGADGDVCAMLLDHAGFET